MTSNSSELLASIIPSEVLDELFVVVVEYLSIQLKNFLKRKM